MEEKDLEVQDERPQLTPPPKVPETKREPKEQARWPYWLLLMIIVFAVVILWALQESARTAGGEPTAEPIPMMGGP